MQMRSLSLHHVERQNRSFHAMQAQARGCGDPRSSSRTTATASVATSPASRATPSPPPPPSPAFSAPCVQCDAVSTAGKGEKEESRGRRPRRHERLAASGGVRVSRERASVWRGSELERLVGQRSAGEQREIEEPAGQRPWQHVATDEHDARGRAEHGTIGPRRCAAATEGRGAEEQASLVHGG